MSIQPAPCGLCRGVAPRLFCVADRSALVGGIDAARLAHFRDVGSVDFFVGLEIDDPPGGDILGHEVAQGEAVEGRVFGAIEQPLQVVAIGVDQAWRIAAGGDPFARAMVRQDAADR